MQTISEADVGETQLWHEYQGNRPNSGYVSKHLRPFFLVFWLYSSIIALNSIGIIVKCRIQIDNGKGAII